MNAIEFTANIRLGLSIGNTLDSTNDKLSFRDSTESFETAWGNPVITEEYVKAVLAAGFNLIRIPVSWSGHICDEESFTVEKNWMKRIKEVVDYAYQNGAYVILNVHHEDWNFPYYDNCEKACYKMKAIWTQIADIFAEYDEHLIFEGQNEPRKAGTALEWNGGDKEGWDVVNATNKAFVETIRSRGGKNPERMLMIPGYAANCSVGIKHIEVPENDDKIIISVHAYEPYEFALEIPGRADWNRDTEAIDELMKELKTRYLDKNIPVIIGEFGAMNKENIAERVDWVTYYLKEASAIGVPCVWWDNALFTGPGELFGLFDRKDGHIVFPEIVEAMNQVIK